MVFFDQDEVKDGSNGMFKVISLHLQTVACRGNTPGFRVLVKPLVRFDAEDDSLIEQCDISINLHKMIAETRLRAEKCALIQTVCLSFYNYIYMLMTHNVLFLLL